MTAILVTMVAALGGLVTIQTPRKETSESSFLPDPNKQPSKYAYEMFAFLYTPIWIFLFAIVVVFQLYEDFDAFTYNTFLGVLALPLILQPLLYPSAGFNSPDQHRPLWERYSTKANLWIAVYSFIGNYWYTHYFYSVLKAEYTMPATRLNNVPICMFFATHFYFTTYHALSNALLRKVVTTYEAGPSRVILFCSVVLVFSYFTAFMETLSISSFPYYSFEDRDMAYTVGSAFYGIYFFVSFPGFYTFDDDIDAKDDAGKRLVTVWDTFVSVCGHGMMILTLLDLVRLYVDVPLIVGTLP
ncbi:hypothetical protein MHU86_25730 [Fragilaria crotonensis]|nr:hypothetical protein MHU86_25730 [Fragilaria crotonensis]